MTLARRMSVCVPAPAFHFLVLYGISANRRALWGGDEAARTHIGYAPQDDAEIFAAEIADKVAEPGSVAARFHGGVVCALGFSAKN